MLVASPTSDVKTLAIAIVSSRVEFDALQAEWDALSARSVHAHSVFQSHAFLGTWFDVYNEPDTTLAIITARLEGRLVGVLPLVRKRTLGLVRLRLMGSPVSQYDDVLVDSSIGKAVATELLAAVGRLDADILELRRIRADGDLWAAWQGNCETFELTESPFAVLDQRTDGIAPGSAYSAKERSNYRRHLRRLEELGPVSFEFLETGDRAAHLARQAVAMKRQALRQGNIVSPVMEAPAFAEFFARFALLQSRGMMVSTILLAGEPVGIDLSFLGGQAAFGHVLAIDRRYAKEGIGSLLLHQAFGNAYQRGAQRYDMHIGVAPYKMHHADGMVEVASRAFLLTPAARLFGRLAYRTGLPLARKALKHYGALIGDRGRKADTE